MLGQGDTGNAGMTLPGQKHRQQKGNPIGNEGDELAVRHTVLGQGLLGGGERCHGQCLAPP